MIPSTSNIPILTSDFNIGPTGTITINNGGRLRTDGNNLLGGGTINLNSGGTLILNGEETANFTTTLSATSTGEVHVINTGAVSPLNLRISGNISSSLLKIEVPSGRTVNLNGSINLSTGNFELKGGVLTGDATETFTVGGTSQLDGNITSAANVTLSGAVTLVSDVTITTTGAAVPTFNGNISSAAAVPPASFTARSLTVNTDTAAPSFGISAAVGSSTGEINTLKINTLMSTGSITVNNANNFSKVDFNTAGASVNIRSLLALEVTGTADTDSTPSGSGGSITLRSGGDINLNTTMSSGGGNISLSAGNAITVNQSTSSGGGNIDITATSNLVINNQLNAGTGNISLGSGGGISQITAGNITARGLALRSVSASASNYILDNDSNDVDNLAANHIGIITYHDANGVDVDRVGTVAGVSTDGGNFTLKALGTGGSIVLKRNVNTVAATGTRGDVILEAGGTVSHGVTPPPTPPTLQGGELQISGSASYDLPNNNDFEGISTVTIGTSPTRTPASIIYKDTNGLVIKELRASSFIDVTAGTPGEKLEVAGSIIAGSTVELVTSSPPPPPPPPATPPPAPTIELRKAAPAFRITAGTSISLSTQGSGTITNTGTGQSLVLSARNIYLQTESGSTGDIGSAPTSAGSTDNHIVTSGTTNVYIGHTTATALPDTVYLTNTDDRTSTDTLTLARLRLNTAADKTIWVEATDVDRLVLPSVNINAGGTGSIKFRSGAALATGGIYSTTGTGDKISLKARGRLTIGHEVNAVSGPTGGNVLLKSGGRVTQTARIIANALVLTDQNPGAPSATYTLTNSSNNVTTLAANTGAVSYTDSNGVNIGSVTFDGQTTTGVNTNDNNFILEANATTATTATTAGPVNINSQVDAGTGNVMLKAGSSVTQTASIKAAALVLTDQGLSSTPPAASPSATYTLTNSSNAVGTLAANTGEVSYTDTDGVDIGAVTVGSVTTAGINTNDQDFILTAGSNPAGESININSVVNAGIGKILLQADGRAAQGVHSPGAPTNITAAELALTRPSGATGTSGAYTLNNDNNAVVRLAANSAGVIYHNNSDLIIGAVSVGSVITTGINTNGSNLTIKALGTISQLSSSHTVTANVTNLTAKNSLLTPALQDIKLQEVGNDFVRVIFEGYNVDLGDSNDLILGDSTKTSSAGGYLDVLTTGDIRDSGAIKVNGITILEAGASGDVILDNPSHDFSDTGSIATGGVTVSGTANVTLADNNHIQLNTININGDLEVTVPLNTVSSTPAMYNINQTSSLSIPGDVKFRGRWNLANNNLSAKSIIALAAAVPGEKGNLIADAGGTPEEIKVIEHFRPDTFDRGNSKLIFSGNSNSLVGQISSVGTAPARPPAAPYDFNDIEIAKDFVSNRVTAINNWTVHGSLTLDTGNWILGNNTHTVHGNWNSNNPPFQFDSDSSTVIFAGGNASVTTGGTAAPRQSFNNIEVNKAPGVSSTSPASRLTLGSGIKIDGDLTITSGEISTGAAGTNDIVISGNWKNNGGTFTANNDTVIFDNSTPKQLTTGDSVFNHLTVRGNSRVNVKDDLTVNGNLAFRKVPGAAGRAAPVLDMEKNNLTVKGSYNALAASVTPGPRAADELGRLRLRGGQTVSLQPPSSASPSSPLTMKYLGIVEYYGSGNASIGTITPGPGTTAQYWHLVISGGTVARLSEDITILGRSGAAGGTLAEPLETNYPGDNNLMGLFIKDKGSSLILNQKTLTLYGSFQNRSGAALNLSGKSKDAVDRGTVNFVGNYPAFIYGKNTFFKFNINDQSGTDSDVGGKIVYFQQHSGAVIDGAPVPPNEPVTEIANYIGAEINILGDNRNGQPTGPPASLPDSSEWVYLVSSGTDKGKYWLFDKEPNAKISLKYVYIRNSDARLHVQSIPDPETVTKPDGTTVEQPIVITEDSLFWFRLIVVEKSVTEDSDADGRIDRILVTAASSMKRKAAGAYEQLEITVKGYKVKAKPDGYSDGPESTQFYINLVEGNTLDTGARPPWRITENLSFIDAGAREEVLKLKGDKKEETPEDGAPPIIGYALAVADSPRNEVFIRFSEPVIDSDKDGWKNNFDFTALENVTVPGDISSVKPVSPGGGTRLEEAVVILGEAVTLEDIYENREFTVSNVKDTADNDLRYDKHRVSDLALGITGNGIVQPTAASGRTSPVGGSSVGAIVKFDGTDFLEADKIRIEAARRNPRGSPRPPVPRILYDNSVSAAFRANGLWLPRFSEGNTPGTSPSRPHGTFSGLVPRPWLGAESRSMQPVSGRSGLFEHNWPADDKDKKIENNTDLEFLFYLPRHKIGTNVFGNLYGARLIDDTASDWYRGVRPWSFLVRDFIEQAGGVTILNNIINPLRGERTSLQYQVTDGGTVTIQVFDLSGNMVEILQRGYQAPGDYAVSWDGRNRGGGITARGIYFIRYVGPGGIDQIRKVLVVK